MKKEFLKFHVYSYSHIGILFPFVDDGGRFYEATDEDVVGGWLCRSCTYIGWQGRANIYISGREEWKM